MSKKNVKAVIFDMDGTLFSTEALYRDAWKKALKDMELFVPDSIQQSLVGRHISDCKKMLISHIPCEKTLHTLCEQTDEYFMAHVHAHDIPLKKGVKLFLDALHRWGVPSAVATNADHARAMLKFKKAKIDHYFQAVIGSDQVMHPKPAPDVFLAAATALNVPPEMCVAIEDSSVGVEAAYRAGMQVVLVPDMEVHEECSLRKTQAVFESMEDVMAYLSKLG